VVIKERNDMKRILIFLFILILFTACSTQRQVVYRDCNCNTTNFGVGWGYNPYWGWNDPFWGWNRWGWNDPFWGGRNQIVIVPQRFREVIPPPTRYNRRRVITPPPTQSARPNNRSITPTPQRRGYDAVYPQRSTVPQRSNRVQPTNRTPTTPQNIRPMRSSPPTNRYAPQRSVTPNRGSYTPTRGGRGNE